MQSQSTTNDTKMLEENSNYKVTKFKKTNDPAKTKNFRKNKKLMMSEQKEIEEKSEKEGSTLKEMDKENYSCNNEKNQGNDTKEFSNVDVEKNTDQKEVSDTNCQVSGENELKEAEFTFVANNLQMGNDLPIKPEGAEFSEEDSESRRKICSKKPAKTMSLEQKVDFLKTLTQISTAYSCRVVQQLDNAMRGARIGKASSEQCERQKGNNTALSTSGNNVGLVTEERAVAVEATLISEHLSRRDMNCKVVLHDINPLKKKVACNSEQKFEVPDLFEGTLKDYQIQGVEWLKILHENAVNGILADEMGLGKTVQTIAFLCFLIDRNVKGPFLVIAPLSTLTNWCLEFQKFCPQVPIILFHGTTSERKKLTNNFKLNILSNKKKVFPVVIMSYETVLRERLFIAKHNWKYLIVDEGHRLKNRQCKLSRYLHTISCDNRLLLTGTPLQNNLEELWSLLHFLMPLIFSAMQEFEYLLSSDELHSNAIFEQEVKEGIISKMHMALSPFILRRLKRDVNLQLPPKKEVLICAPISQLQWELYNEVMHGNISQYLGLSENVSESEMPQAKRRCTVGIKYNEAGNDDFDELDEEEYDWGQLSRNKSHTNTSSSTYCCNKIITDNKGKQYWINLKMQAPLFQLKKITNHPYLIKMPIGPNCQIVVDENLIKSSGKMMILDTLLPHLKARGHKVLLFSTMTTILDLIEEYAIFRGYEYSRLDGKFKLDERTIQINNFMTDGNNFLFLISTRAGSLGLNLTSADTVIIFDSDWNPQVDLQAQDRCHRIGQTKPVVVYRLVAKGTIDEKILSYAQDKRKLEKLVLHKNCYKGRSMERTDNFASVQELKELLASNDYSKVVHTTGTLFRAGELEELLDRSHL